MSTGVLDTRDLSIFSSCCLSFRAKSDVWNHVYGGGVTGGEFAKFRQALAAKDPRVPSLAKLVSAKLWSTRRSITPSNFPGGRVHGRDARLHETSPRKVASAAGSEAGALDRPHDADGDIDAEVWTADRCAVFAAATKAQAISPRRRSLHVTARLADVRGSLPPAPAESLVPGDLTIMW